MIVGFTLLIPSMGEKPFSLLVIGVVTTAAIGLSILVLNNANKQQRLNQLMGPNVALTLATPVALSILMMWN
jgi:hypothetical protein